MIAVMATFILSLLIGLVAGLRAMTAPAAVSWASHIGWLNVAGTTLAFLAHPLTPWVFTVLALGELVFDQLPATPSRTMPLPFGARIMIGALCGGAIGAGGGALVTGLVAGIAGAIVGTLGGHAGRAQLAAAFGRDRPAALIEDAVAVGGALLIMVALP
jgi:uncharacterized membrane protein